MHAIATTTPLLIGCFFTCYATINSEHLESEKPFYKLYYEAFMYISLRMQCSAEPRPYRVCPDGLDPFK